MEKVSNFIKDKIHWFTVIGALLICGFFLLITHPSESGEYRTLDGNDARIYESTEQIMEEAREAIITYSDTEVPAVIINENGEEETIEVPTVERPTSILRIIQLGSVGMLTEVLEHNAGTSHLYTL